MTAAPPNFWTRSTAAPFARWIVLLGDTDGTAPLRSQEVKFLIPLSVQRFSGDRPNIAEFKYDFGRTGEHIQDMQALMQWTRQVEIRQVNGIDIDPDTEEAVEDWEPVFRGELIQQSFRIVEGGESARIFAEMLPRYQFGEMLTGERQYNPVAGGGNLAGEKLVVKDLEFNPLIDAKILPNMSDRKSELSPTNTWNLWIDAEAGLTSAARSLQGVSSVSNWTLAEAVQSICGLLNYEEANIFNPLAVFEINGERVEAEMFANAPSIENVTLRLGQYLPTYLDEILIRRGYSWVVDLYRDLESDTTKLLIAIYNRIEGRVTHKVDLQRYGETVDPAKTIAKGVEVESNIAEVVNTVEGVSSREQVELTIDLVRGWPESLDSKTAEELDRDAEFNQYPNVWRLFPANEAGDWTGTRPEITEAPNLSTVFDVWIPHRCPMEDALTQGADGYRRAVMLELSDDAGSTWTPVDPSNWQILADQCGVYFSGDVSDLIAAGDDLKLRLTGTMSGCGRITYEATTEDSPNSREVKLFLDLSDRFHKRTRLESGDYVSQLYLADTGSEADEADDQEALEAYCDAVLESEQAAGLRGAIAIDGIELSYQVGDLIEAINGREIVLNAHSPDVEAKQFVQITQIVYEYPGTTTLVLEAV